MEDNIFKDKRNNLFGGITYKELVRIIYSLQEEYGVTIPQVVEDASFSLSMVIRSHLGLSAENGYITVIAKDNLAGFIALATVRRLYNAGTNSNVILLKNGNNDFSKEFEDQAQAVSALNIDLMLLDLKENEKDITNLFSDSDNVLMGTYDENAKDDKDINFISDILNELSTPVHSIISPHGISDVDGKKNCSSPIYSSSTLSLGIPLQGLSFGDDYVGRHYLSEVSIPLNLSNEKANLPSNIFSEQPVCQIFKN